METTARCETCRTLAVVPDCGNRSRRVIVLILGIIVLSLADLVVTLAFLNANWMLEANPIAEYLIRRTQSPLALIAFKLMTVGICAGLLYRVRRHGCGEVAAWCAIAILTVLSIMWHSYSRHFNSPEDEDIVLAQIGQTDGMPLGFN